MSGFTFRTGMAFEWNGTGYRIERLGPSNQVVLEHVTDGQVVLTTRGELLDSYRSGSVIAKTNDASPDGRKQFGRPLDELPAAVQGELRRRMSYIQMIEDSSPVTFTAHCLGPLIAAVASDIEDKKRPSVTTVYRWFSRYRAQRERRSLIPRYDLRGGSQARQGEPVLELLVDATEDACKLSPAATGSNIYDRLKGKIKQENARRLPEDQLVVPSLRTVYRLLDRTDLYDLYLLRKGKAAADRRFCISGAGPKVTDILERVEVDHTPLDLFLVDEVSLMPLGRPILTLFIDVYSRFPLGYFLSFGGTSTSVVMGAFRHAVLPKPKTHEVLPNLPVIHEWPCYGQMDCLVLDNGFEFHSDDLGDVAYDLGCRLQFCPKRAPRYKGVVERFLKTVNYFFAHQLPGTSLSSLVERGDYDPQKHAVLTTSEFIHLFEKWLLDVYAQTVHRRIKMTPWDRWHEGLTRRTLELPNSLSTLQRRIGLVEERRLRNDGITLKGLQFAGPELVPIIRRWGPGVKVRIVFDPQDLGEIQVWPPEEHEPVTVPAIDQQYARGLTLYQHELIRQRVRENGQSAEDGEALADAKYQIALAIDQLISSRKQKNRRRAAHIRGVTSAKPNARLEPSARRPDRPKSEPQSERPAYLSDELPGARFQSFRLSTKTGD